MKAKGRGRGQAQANWTNYERRRAQSDAIPAIALRLQSRRLMAAVSRECGIGSSAWHITEANPVK